MSDSRKKVVIVGGGVGALETAIGLHDSQYVDVDVMMVTPQTDFYYRPYAVLEPFGFHQQTKVPISDLLEGCNTRLVIDKVSRVDLRLNQVVLASGELVRFDALVVSTGAQALEGLEGAITVGNDQGTKRMQLLLREIDADMVHSVAFVAPSGASWTLPVYEFAMLTTAHAQHHLRPELQVSVVTPEHQPLQAFGREAAEKMQRALAELGVELRLATTARSFAGGELAVSRGSNLAVDRVVTLPVLVGHRIPGLPHDADGFLPVDEHCLVAQTSNVYAAGDITDFPVKQGGIAAQQADTVIASLSVRFGTQSDLQPFVPELNAVMFSGQGATYLTGVNADPLHESPGMTELPPWSDTEKIVSRHLAGRMRRVRAAEMRMTAR